MKHLDINKKAAMAVIPLALSVCASAVCSMPAAAADAANDGIEASLSLRVVGRGNILGDLSIRNTNDFDMDHIDISVSVPDGYDGEKSVLFPERTDMIKSGEKVALSSEFAKIIEDDGEKWGPSYGSSQYRGRSSSIAGAYVYEGNIIAGSYTLNANKKRASDSSSSSSSDQKKGSGNNGTNGTPSTGDSFPVKTLAAMMIASGTAAALCFRTKNGKKLMALVICTAVCGSSVPGFISHAEDETAPSSEPADQEQKYEVHTFEIQETINVDDTDRIVKVTFTYDYPTAEEPSSETALFDVNESVLDEKTGAYYIFTKQPVIGGSLKQYKNLSGLSYTITDRNDHEIMSGELEHEDSWSIEAPGLIMGENNLNFTMEFEDGSEKNETIRINNLCKENMEPINADKEDSDNDGVLNFIEEIYHTDPNEADSDGDGLTDGDEINILCTDPLKKDSDDNNIDDGDEDNDCDGISNHDEIYVHFTSPVSADTDGDGLNDNDEINKYKTSPVDTDTDGDKASDIWEIKNAFDPVEPDEDFGDLTPDESTVRCEDSEVKIYPVINEPYLTENIPGFIGIEPFRIQLHDDKEAEINIPLEETDISEEKVPALYRYDKDGKRLIETDLKLIREEKKDDKDETYRKPVRAEAVLKASGTYILLDKHCFCDGIRQESDETKNADVNDEKQRHENSVDIFFIEDSEDAAANNKAENEQEKTASNKLIVRKYTGRLRSKKPAAIVRFTALSDKTAKEKTDIE